MTKDLFPERLRNLRRAKNLSQTELGKVAGIHYTHISRYERGFSKPSTETLKGLATALGVSTDYLIEGTPESAIRAKFEDQDLLKKFQEVETLPDEEKTVIKKVLDAFLMKRKLQVLVGA